ncbi:MAG: PDZ domain-containing protein [Luteolibacter sp.]
MTVATLILGMVASPIPACGLELPQKLFENLRSKEFRVRESAQLELLSWARQQPEPAMSKLYLQSRIADDPEVRERCLGVLRELVTDEYLKDGEGYIGIMMRDMIANVPGDPKPRSVVNVMQVLADSAAHRAGLQANDLITGLDDLVWHDGLASLPFSERIRSKKPNSKVTVQLLRDGKLIDLVVVLGRRPPIPNNLFFNDQSFDPGAIERAAKEAYFRRWLSQRKTSE